MPKISVIIPVYNVEQYLKECLESVINQTFQDIEIICVDDGSKDNSLKILNEYSNKDSRIKVISQKNSGQGIARNTGIKLAQGEYIFFLDSDDYINLDILEKLYQKAIDTKSDIVISQTTAFAEEQTEALIKRTEDMNKWAQQAKETQLENYQINEDSFTSAIIDVSCVLWGRLIKKDFLCNNKIEFLNKHVIHEDNGFWLKVCANFPTISSVPDIGVLYRIRNQATTSYVDNNENIQQERYKIMKLVLNDVFDYIKQNFNKQQSKLLIDLIKDSKEYTSFFEYKFGFLYKFKWTLNEKYLYILGLRLFKEKFENDKKITKVLGIKVGEHNYA